MAFRLILSVLLFSGVAFAANNDKGAGSLNVAVVDIQQALAASIHGKKAQKDYKAEVKARQSELDKKKTEYEKRKDSFQKQQKSLSKKALREKFDELERLEKELKRTYQDSHEDLRRKNAEIVAELVQKLRKVVLEYGKENNYTVILDKGSEALLFADQTVDVTDEVIARFNQAKN